MATDVDSLIKRGLISQKAAEQLTPTLADLLATYGSPPSFSGRLAAYGAPPSDNVEDRRGDPKDPYVSMQAANNFVGAVARHLFPFLRDLDIPTPQPRLYPRQAGPLREQAGYYDIQRAQEK